MEYKVTFPLFYPEARGWASWASLVAQMVKRLPAMRDTQVRSLGWEDLLEKETATHSSILAWRIPRTEEHGRLQSMGSQRVGHDWASFTDVFLALSCISDHSVGVVNLIFGSSAFFKSSLNIWKFTVHILLKPGLENFEHYFASVWDECNCVVVWTFFGTAFLWDWNENWPFPVLWPLLSFPKLLAYWVQHFHSIIC